MCGLGNFVILASKKCLVETEVLGQVTPKRVLTEMKLESGKQKGVAVQTEFIHSGSFVRIADGWFATSNWPIVKVNVGDEIAMFTKSTKSDSSIVGVASATSANTHSSLFRRGWKRYELFTSPRKLRHYPLRQHV